MDTQFAATMRSQTPDFNFAQPAGISSPPETPTSPTFTFGTKSSRRHGMQNFPPGAHTSNGHIWPNGNGPQFSYQPSARAEDLSPRSSSPSSDSSGSPPRSISSFRSRGSEPELAEREAGRYTPPRVITNRANFTLEEMTESDFEDYDSDDDVIRPYHYEDAESDQARSFKATAELDPRVLSDFSNLACEEDAQLDPEQEREAWVEAVRAEKRKKRRSSSSVQKRTISQSIGSDTDEEDTYAPQLDASEAGSSARRLRRKTDRSSLIFDDPPPRIDELEEPESCEEIVSMHDDDEDDGLPYWRQEMDVDSNDE